jgi:2-dehydro-3-deoxyphosphogalactonate aldolase
VTPTEAFAALAAGARDLKVFPASSLAPTHFSALKDVLPADCRLWAVGGTNAANLTSWLTAGAFGVGVGGALYRPGDSPEAVHAKAEALVRAWKLAKM